MSFKGYLLKSGEGESVFNGYRVSVVQGENSLEMDGGDGS